jgi:membrane protein implicated in regulation of membrane protease activity
MTWWVWILLGFSLLALELGSLGTFYLLFFGIGALVVGVIVLIGAGGPAWVQWLLFSALSIVSLVLFRKRLLEGMRGRGGAEDVDALVGERAVLLDDLAPGQVGKAELRGTAWNARSADERPLRRGEWATVARVEGLTLWLRAQ